MAMGPLWTTAEALVWDVCACSLSWELRLHLRAHRFGPAANAAALTTQKP